MPINKAPRVGDVKHSLSSQNKQNALNRHSWWQPNNLGERITDCATALFSVDALASIISTFESEFIENMRKGRLGIMNGVLSNIPCMLVILPNVLQLCYPFKVDNEAKSPNQKWLDATFEEKLPLNRFPEQTRDFFVEGREAIKSAVHEKFKSQPSCFDRYVLVVHTCYLILETAINIMIIVRSVQDFEAPDNQTIDEAIKYLTVFNIAAYLTTYIAELLPKVFSFFNPEPIENEIQEDEPPLYARFFSCFAKKKPLAEDKDLEAQSTTENLNQHLLN
jgi:hypothetical protein